jgi:hypothetical protein
MLVQLACKATLPQELFYLANNALLFSFGLTVFCSWSSMMLKKLRFLFLEQYDDEKTPKGKNSNACQYLRVLVGAAENVSKLVR